MNKANDNDNDKAILIEEELISEWDNNQSNSSLNMLKLQSDLEYPTFNIESLSDTTSNDLLASRNNWKYKCNKNTTNNNDYYSSTKLDSRSRQSKVITTPLDIVNKKLSKTTQLWKNDNNGSTRLYNYGFYLKNKIKDQRRDEEEKMIKRMKPKTNKSLIIEWNNTPIKYNNKSMHHHNDGFDEFKYHPSLNQHSLTIAQRLEPSYTRLTKKRKTYKSNNSYQSNKSSFELSYDYNSLSYSNFPASHNRNLNHQKSKTKDSTPKHIQSIYTTALYQMQNKQRACEDNKRIRAEEYKKFSFKPNITQSRNSLKSRTTPISLLYDASLTKGLSPSAHYTKQVNWKNRIEKRNQMKKDQIDREDLSHCTFSPKIEPLVIANDEEIIMRNVSVVNEYLAKRRNVLQLKTDNEEYKKKRFFDNSMGFSIKTTKPNEYVFHPKNEKRRCCKEVTKSRLIQLQLEEAQMMNKSLKKVTIKKDNI